MGGKQLGFSDYELTTAKKQTKREKFLSVMKVVVPWQALIEVPTMRRFASIELIGERIPDETTILTFRHLLEKHELGAQILETVKTQLNAQGMAMRQGTIVDATLIAAPGSTKNKEGMRNPKRHQTKKGYQWYYGM